jgi:hypothetical protein
MTVREPLRLGWSLGGSARLFYWNEPSTPSFSMLSMVTCTDLIVADHSRSAQGGPFHSCPWQAEHLTGGASWW